MTPFRAWLGRRTPYAEGQMFTGEYIEVFTDRSAAAANRNGQPKRVLIVEDTEANRQLLGMEEG